MELLRELLERIRQKNLVAGHFRGLCHVAVGRRVLTAKGELVSAGATWRELAALLRDSHYERELVAELGADPAELAPRDRQRFWYSAIALARPDSAEAYDDAEELIPLIESLGYRVGPAPGGPSPKSLSSPPPVPPAQPPEQKTGDEPPPKRGRKKK